MGATPRKSALDSSKGGFLIMKWLTLALSVCSSLESALPPYLELAQEWVEGSWKNRHLKLTDRRVPEPEVVVWIRPKCRNCHELLESADLRGKEIQVVYLGGSIRSLEREIPRLIPRSGAKRIRVFFLEESLPIDRTPIFRVGRECFGPPA